MAHKEVATNGFDVKESGRNSSVKRRLGTAAMVIAGTALVVTVAGRPFILEKLEENRIEEYFEDVYGAGGPLRGTEQKIAFVVDADAVAETAHGKTDYKPSSIIISNIGACSLKINARGTNTFELDDSGAVTNNSQAYRIGSDESFGPETIAVNPGERVPAHYYIGQADLTMLREAADNCPVPGTTITP